MPVLYLTALEEDLLRLLTERELYPLEIEQAFKDVCGRQRNFGSFYPTLRKLENRGLLSSRWGDDLPEERTGPRRRYYKVTGLGAEALREADKRRLRLTEWALSPNKG
jgi:DNA-binding PadR family transcriptional regulator